MRKIIILFFMLFGVASAQNSNILKEIKNTEAQLYPAVERNDIPVMEKLFHPKFAIQSNDGYYSSKNNVLAKFREGKNPYQLLKPNSDSIVIVNKHLVIATGKETYIHKTGDDKGKEKTRHFMHIWTKYKGRWTLAGRYLTN